MAVARRTFILFAMAVSMPAFYLVYAYKAISWKLMKTTHIPINGVDLPRHDVCNRDLLDITTSPAALQQQPETFSYYYCPLNNNNIVIRYEDDSFRVTGTTCLLNQINFIIANTDFCQRRPGLRYLIYFHAAADDAQSRDALRRTWANSSLLGDRNTAAIFMIGLPKNRSDQKRIFQESYKHGDLVQGEFVDSYRNLSVKATMALRWVSANCRQISHVIKSDVDVFANIFKLLSFVERNRFYHIICNSIYTSPVQRGAPENCFKWCVEPQYQFVRRYYPQYCSGLLYILDSRLAEPLYEAAQNVPSFWIDDVFITGVLVGFLTRLGGNIQQYYLQSADIDVYTDKMIVQIMNESISLSSISYLATHVTEPKKLEQLWKFLMSRLPDSYLR